ncbi:MAG: restriction endonuclease subunit S [Paludibacter sp.]|nr:restriction endonuclease subunit S [Paludibacter sp.]
MSEFELSKISDFGDIVTGSTPPTNNSLYWNGEYNFYSPADFNDNAYCEKTDKTITKLGLSQGREIPQDSIMVTCIASIGKIAINKSIGLTNQQINTIIPFDKYDFKYIYYLLSHNTAKIKGIAAQTTIPILNKTDFGKFQLLATKDKSKQQQISQILSTCDTVIEQTQTAIEKYKAIKQGMLHDLFTRGLTAGGQLRPTPQQAPELYKQSELGLIPKEWEVKRLEEIATIHSGIDYKKNPQGEDVPIYGTGGIMGYTSMSLNEGPAVLTGRKGSINRPFYVEGKFWNVDTIFCLKTIGENNSKWLYYNILRINMNRYNEATGVPSITSKTLNKLSFCHYSKNEQDKIIELINPIDTKLQSEEALLSKYQSIKKGLMSDLLSGKKPLTPPDKISG